MPPQQKGIIVTGQLTATATQHIAQAGLDTPVGWLCVTERDGAIVRLDWSTAPAGASASALTERALAQLRAYFAHELTEFDLPLAVAGSDFQRRVCAAMSAIPLGGTRTYGEIARELGAAAQPVGNACGANPIPVIIPCHRVLGAGGLGGFSGAGGVETKVALLRHEGAAGLLI
ncbi:methylated-DNA--[protein]-cysteine S-methyltransferase [Phaeobacter sp. JH20_13]|uniref:methylated-DNA--[protein]-cysteine S-methyltransferase n=1 Tax=Phaeobacter sp. JH20_13 TaxID=3112472 RepID=UPI003A8504A6